MTRTLTSALLAGLLGLSAAAYADTTVTLNMAEADGAGKSIGTVDLADSPYGLVLTPKLTGLPPGQHGFHIHQNGSCDAKDDNGKKVPAGAAGGHFDPKGTKKHGTPWDDGAHAGDLPALFVGTDGSAVYPVLAPRLKEADVKGLALMVHVGGDNHSDHPEALGGGGGRMACGVIPK